MLTFLGDELIPSQQISAFFFRPSGASWIVQPKARVDPIQTNRTWEVNQEICELLGDLLEHMDPMVGTLTQKYIQCGAPVR